MKISRLLSIIFLSFLSLNCSAKDIQKVLTDNYGVLTGKYIRIYSMPNDNLSNIYWQCFTRNNVKVELETLTDFNDFNDDDEIYSLIEISARNKNGDIHKYIMRRAWPVITYQTMLNRWLSLITGEKYVCIAGSGFSVDDGNEGRKKYTWYFEKLKTKKGCASYFSDKNCNDNPSDFS